MKRMKCKKSLVALSCLALFSCGSEEGENTFIPPESNSPSNLVTAYDKVAAAPLNTPVSLDLSSYVSGDDVVIDDISSDTPEYCYSYVDSLKSVKVEIAKLGRCRYTYVAENDLGETAQGKIELISSAEEDPILDTISMTTSLDKLNNEAEPATIEISLIILDGYLLQAEDEEGNSTLSVESKSGSSDVEITKKTDSTLSLSLASGSKWLTGWHKINYQLVNQERDSILIGDVFVSIAGEINQPPVIDPPLFSYDQASEAIKEKLNYEIGTDTDKTINLSELHCGSQKTDKPTCLTIYDPDLQPWQLAEVSSMGSSKVTLTNDNLYNQSFIFSTSVPGVHDVSYLVTDNEGAYSMGVLRLNAAEKYLNAAEKYLGAIRNWTDLAYNESSIQDTVLDSCNEITNDKFRCYQAPKTHAEVMASNPHYYHPEDINGVEFYVALWDFDDAKKLCNGTGNSKNSLDLPSTERLEDLFGSNKASTKERLAQWPKDHPYITDNEYEMVEFNGEKIDKNLPERGYVTCFARKA